MRTRSVLTLLGLMAAGMLTPVTAGAAAPVAAHCGAVLSTAAYLPADLSCPAGNGLTLAGNITLDLRHHQLIGPGSSGTAISVRSGSSPRVQNGTIKSWDAGISSTIPDDEQGASGTTILSSVTFTGNAVGIAASGPLPGGAVANYVIKNSRFDRNGYGVQGVFTGAITVSNSSFYKNGTGIQVDTGRLTVSNSRFDANGKGVDCEETSCTLKGSYLTGNQTAIATRTLGITATSNIIRANTIGLEASGATGHRLSYNAFVDNKTGVDFFAGGGTLNRNSFTGNGVGFTSSGGGDPFTAELNRNVFAGNGDGISIADPGTSLKGNIAIRNSRWGIYAPESTDLGGNRAFGNGNSPQCVGVVC